MNTTVTDLPVGRSRIPANWKPWLFWVLANTIGGFLGMWLAQVIPFGQEQYKGVIVWGVVGLAQWVVLWIFYRINILWAFATMVGGGLAVFTYMLIFQSIWRKLGVTLDEGPGGGLLLFFLCALGSSIAPAIAQGLVARLYSRRALWWACTTGITWVLCYGGVGWIFSFVLTPLLFGSWIAFIDISLLGVHGGPTIMAITAGTVVIAFGSIITGSALKVFAAQEVGFRHISG